MFDDEDDEHETGTDNNPEHYADQHSQSDAYTCQSPSIYNILLHSHITHLETQSMAYRSQLIISANEMNAGDTVFVRCVRVCVSMRSGTVNQSSLKRLKLRASKLTCICLALDSKPFDNSIQSFEFVLKCK